MQASSPVILLKHFLLCNELVHCPLRLQAQLPGLSIEFPVVIFAVVATIAGILMYWIPETVCSPMHQTIEETEAAEDDYRIPCCGKKLHLPKPKSRQVIWI